MNGFRHNAILILCAEGHVEVELEGGTGPRREAYLSIPAVKTKEEARVVGEQFLRLSQEDAATLSISGRALGSQHVPGFAFNLLDTMDGDPVMSYSVALEDEGYAQITPEIGEALDQREEALERKIQRLSTGVLPEYGSPPRPEKAEEGQGSGTPSPWSHGDEVEEMSGVDPDDPAMPEKGASPPWLVRNTYHISWLEATATAAGWGLTRIQAILQKPVPDDPGRFQFDYVLGEVQIPAGRFTGVKLIDISIPAGKRVVLVCPAQGGVKGLTVRIVGAQVGGR